MTTASGCRARNTSLMSELFPDAGHARDDGENAHRDVDANVLQVVRAGVIDAQMAPGGPNGFLDRQLRGQVFPGERIGLEEFFVTPLEDDASPLRPGARPDIDDVIRGRDDGRVVLDDDDGVASIAQL